VGVVHGSSDNNELLSNLNKMTVNRYFEIVCDRIEDQTKKIIKNEKLNSFGGVCYFSIKKVDDVSYVYSKAELYFQNSNETWIKKEILGKTKVSRFDTTDKDTLDFLNQVKTEGVKQDIAPISI
jgi:hypothetical protein